MMRKLSGVRAELKMKKPVVTLLAATMMLSLVACGGKNADTSNPSEGTSKEVSNEVSKETSKEASDVTSTQLIIPSREYDKNDPTAVLGEITNDFADVITQLTEKQKETFSAVGTSFEDYQKNKGLVDEWITLVLSESDALFARTRDNSIAYFKLIAADEDHKYKEFCDEALDKYYDVVYEDAMDEYYDALYEDAMEDLYDEYYDGIVNDAYDSMKYEEWSNASRACYETWSKGHSDIYKKWSAARSYVYGLRSSVNSAFCYNDNFDVDSVISEYDKIKAEEAAKIAEEEAKVYVDLDVVYEINSDGDAEVVGFSGEGNRITISSEYEGEDVVRIADSAFENCTALEKIIMWADIKEIGNYAFKGCTGLTEFSVPSDTEIIGHHAFEGCTNLENLIIWGDPDIGEYAFADCISLTEISIGNETKNIYPHAFDGCTNLKTAIIWSDDTAIGKDAFANCPNLKDAPTERGKIPEYTVSTNENAESNTNDKADKIVKNENTDDTTGGIRPDFKEAMDSYEAFYTEYCKLIKEYTENPSDMAIIKKYTSMYAKAEEMDEAFKKWDEKDLNNEELKYYMDVNNNVMKMLIDIAG